jgi:hypothetical protein
MSTTNKLSEKTNVEVVIRVRPLNSKEKANGSKKCVSVLSENTLLLDARPEPKQFNFDLVGDEAFSQA